MKPIIIVIAGSALLLFSLNNRPTKTRTTPRSQTARMAGGGAGALRSARK